MAQRKRERLYCGYSGNTNSTSGLVQNEWVNFPYPSGGYEIYRDSEDFTIDPTLSKFTYNGFPGWFDISAVCNVYKETGGVNRNLEVVWYQNGSPVGNIRGFYMSSQDSTIITGVGQLYIDTGDTLEPMIRNIENTDDIRLDNCTFDFRCDIDWGN